MDGGVSNEERINSPAHYNAGRIEPIEVIEDLGMERGFCLGNALKYISRAGKKPGSSEVEDLKKSVWYLQRYIRRLEQQDTDNKSRKHGIGEE